MRKNHLGYINEVYLFKKYANLLINYCIQPKRNEVILVSSTTASTSTSSPTLEYCLDCGAHIDFDLSFPQQSLCFFYTHANTDQLVKLPIAAKEKASAYRCYNLYKCTY